MFFESNKQNPDNFILKTDLITIHLMIYLRDDRFLEKTS